jgi:tripartite-type tricarboxylate transporter receptor subunit TctC
LSLPLGEALDAQLFVDNIGGASGAIGIQKLATSSPDGDQIALGTDSDTLLVPLTNLQTPYRPADLRLIALVGSAPMILAAGPRLRSASLSEITRSAVSRDGAELLFGNFGVDSISHMIAATFAKRTHVRLLHVPYKGIAPLIQDLMAGEIDVAFLPLAGGIPAMLSAGKLRALGIAAPQRHPLLPEVPTIGEVTKLSDFNFSSWSGIVVPRAVSTPIAERLNAAVRKSLSDPAFRRSLESTGATVAAPMSLEESARFFERAELDYRGLVDSARVHNP